MGRAGEMKVWRVWERGHGKNRGGKEGEMGTRGRASVVSFPASIKIGWSRRERARARENSCGCLGV